MTEVGKTLESKQGYDSAYGTAYLWTAGLMNLLFPRRLRYRRTEGVSHFLHGVVFDDRRDILRLPHEERRRSDAEFSWEVRWSAVARWRGSCPFPVR